MDRYDVRLFFGLAECRCRKTSKSDSGISARRRMRQTCCRVNPMSRHLGMSESVLGRPARGPRPFRIMAAMYSNRSDSLRSRKSILGRRETAGQNARFSDCSAAVDRVPGRVWIASAARAVSHSLWADSVDFSPEAGSTLRDVQPASPEMGQPSGRARKSACGKCDRATLSVNDSSESQPQNAARAHEARVCALRSVVWKARRVT